MCSYKSIYMKPYYICVELITFKIGPFYGAFVLTSVTVVYTEFIEFTSKCINMFYMNKLICISFCTALLCKSVVWLLTPDAFNQTWAEWSQQRTTQNLSILSLITEAIRELTVFFKLFVLRLIIIREPTSAGVTIKRFLKCYS